MKQNDKYLLVIHGGVGTILKKNMTPEKENAYLQVLKEAVEAGEQILKNDGVAVQAVEAAIITMEDSPLFNAGKGAVFTHDERNEMDASIMDGKTMMAGAVCNVERIKNPIIVAREVMENSDHVMLAAGGAEEFAKIRECELVDPSYFYTKVRFEQLQFAKENDEVLLDHTGENKIDNTNFENGGKKYGTVGAVALDMKGNLASATSTGGMTNKRFGRIGDAPIIGAGTYANNNTCAVSCTGHGEYFIRNVVAYDIHALMEYKQMSLADASDHVIHKKLMDQDGEGGLIAIDKDGNYVHCFNTPGMYRGVVGSHLESAIEIYK